ncbi:right-handed parallel beta-helix repeat-containing protein [Pseudobacter ginsenosidimutans]|nr:choice-of-anchor Q domain-containing protein [Pseudobacter ginsenosidimutans]
MKKILLRISLPVVLLCTLVAALQAQTIRYVRQGGSGNGSSWASASGNFQAMIDASSAGDQVWVAGGDYQTPAGSPFTMKEGVKIYGGFPNTGTPAWANRNFTTNITRLLGVTNPYTGNRVIENRTALTVAALLDGFTITNGYVAGSNHGGGISNIGASPTISNCIITQNAAGSEGGGLYNFGSSPVVTNCTFLSNISGKDNNGQGGAVANVYGTPVFNDCVFQNNRVLTGGAGTGGGGMYNSESNPVLTGCKFFGNKSYDGGGMFNYKSGATISNTEFSGNTSALYGGALYNYSNANIKFKNCNFNNNNSGNGGAIANGYFSELSLENCLLFGNRAIGGGGSGNGGAIHNRYAKCTITSSTITGNIGELRGGDISSEEVFSNYTVPCVVIHNSILYANSSGIDLYRNVVQIHNSIIQGHTSASSTIIIEKVNTIEGQDPLFVNAANAVGADGIWGTTDDGYRLQVLSPAVNMGNNTLLPAGVLTDFAGATRIQGGTIDMGAYESSHVLNCGSTKLYVDGSKASSGTGASWGEAFKTMSEAMHRALQCNNVAEIHVAKGTYYPTGDQSSILRDSSFLIPARGGLKLYGGYPNGGGTRNPVTNPTVLSGDIGTAGFHYDNSYHVLVMTGSLPGADSVVIDGFTVTRGYSDGGTNYYNDVLTNQHEGGGILLRVNPNIGSKVAIRNCNVVNNHANGLGGGIYVWQTTPSIINCVIADNSSGSDGGGLYNQESGTTRLINCAFIRNSCTNGAAMYNRNAAITIVNNTIFGNTASVQGGAVLNTFPGSISIQNSIVWNNGNNSISDAATLNAGYSNIQQASGVYAGTGNINADPLFVNSANAAGADGIWRTADDGLKLQNASTLINNGNPDISGLGLDPFDLQGTERVQRGRIDMGAYESPFIRCGEYNTLYVDAAVAQPGNGSSWAAAFKTLKEAFDVLNSCATINTIMVAEGTYYPTSTNDRDAAFLIPARGNVKIYGGYASGGGARDFNTYKTILSGDIGAASNIADNSYHIMVLANLASGTDSVVLDGFTFTQANGDGSGSNTINGVAVARNTGGGICLINNANYKTMIRNCRSVNNRALQGAGIYCLATSPYIVSTMLQGNSSSDNGGGISIYNSSQPVLMNVLISGNRAGYGAAVFNDNSNPYIINCTITDNWAAGDAGGFYNRLGIAELTFRNSVVYGNRNGGGAISNILNTQGGKSNFTYSLIETASVAWEAALGTDNGNNLFGDPEFVERINPTTANTPHTSGNYQAQAGSSLIDGGSSVLLPAGSWNDITGVPRTLQAYPDIGAYESPFFNCDILKIDSSKTNVLCYGAATGKASVLMLRGKSPFTYAWSNGAATAAISNLAAGDYSVTVTDANGCSISKTISIAQPAAPLDATVILNNVKCFGNSEGSASLTVSGGQAPYQYSWSNGSTASAISNLPAGVYDCTIKDANGCSIVKSVTITQPAAALNLNITKTDIVCNGQNTGIANAVISGGALPYTYEWNNNATTSSLTGLAAGTYTCTVTDGNGCIVSKSISIVEPAALSVANVVANVSCLGANNGKIELTPAGGTGSYSYSWNNGETSSSLNNLAPGTYSCIIKDAANCQASASFTITQPAAALSVTTNQSGVICYGSNAGYAGVVASGGTAPYNYLWSNGASTASVNNLSAGTYSCTVSDAAGCTDMSVFTITQNTAITLDGTVTQVACYNSNTGSVSVAASGGIAPYNYLWSTGSTADAVSGLTAGIHTCTVTDAAGCSASKTFTIAQPATALMVTVGKTDIACFNAGDGKASVIVSGGLAPYTYSWSNGGSSAQIENLVAGDYNCTITDNYGCTKVVQVSIIQPAQGLTLSIQKTDVSCNTGNNGSATANVSGGTPPYSYSWSNGGNAYYVSALFAGTFSCTVTDALGCKASETITVSEPDPLVLNPSTTNVLCYGANNGTAAVNVTGGTSPYTYNWDNGAESAAISNLAPRLYFVDVRDANGCRKWEYLNILQPAALNAQVISLNNVFCGLDNTGEALLQVSGGIAPYDYLWSNGSTAAFVQGLAVGDHSCVITDANGCVVNKQVTINNLVLSGNKIFVDKSVAVSGNGSSWSQAFKHLSDAFKAAASCSGIDSILVAKGTYTPLGGSATGNRDSAFLFRQSGGLKLIGGYPSGGGLRDIDANATVLSGEIRNPGNGDNSHHVLVIAGISSASDSIVIDGVSVIRGYGGNGANYFYNGVELSNSNGMGLYLVNNNIEAGKIAIRNCRFADHFTFGSGAAIHNEQSAPSVIHCSFSGNIAVYGQGGAIMNQQSPKTLIANCEFSNNEASSGGAIYNSQNSDAKIDQCRFLDNTASFGGAIGNEHSAPVITNCFIAGNKSGNTLGGAGIGNNNASPVIINTHFIRNIATNGYGGGLSNFINSTATVTNCNFYGNEGTGGTGAIYNYGSHLTIRNSISYGNDGGITNDNGSTTSASYSLIEYWSGGGTGNLNSSLDPMYVAPVYTAPYTQGDFRLKTCSPAINAGTTDTTGLNLPIYEVAIGLPRIQLGRIDLGPHEANSYTDANAASIPSTAASGTAFQLKDNTTWYGTDCTTLIAAVTGSGSNPVSGITTASVDMEANLLPGFVSRYYEIEPEQNGGSSSGTITLYFSQSEFSAYNTANNGTNKLPLPDKDDPEMNDDFVNIRIRKVSGAVSTTVIPHTINWNASRERWELSFDVTSFSKFYVFTENNAALPLRLLSFAVREENCTAKLSWTTAEETGVSHFEVEQSTDGTHWSFISKLKANNTTGEHKYNAEVNIDVQMNFYRLKMVDIDGTTTYSKIVRLTAPAGCSARKIKLFPNPADNIIYLEKANPGDQYTVYDNAGRIVLQGRISKAVQDINVANLVMGMYTVTVVNRTGGIQAFKFVKR